jgi:hypothetical protein
MPTDKVKKKALQWFFIFSPAALFKIKRNFEELHDFLLPISVRP